MGAGKAGIIAGIVLLALGLPMWLISVAQILLLVPKGKLITTGPFAAMQHPIYTSVALLVLPGLGLVLDTWLGPVLGVILYASSRIFSGSEEKILARIFAGDYERYRSRVLIPWL